jgi:hypothetical protein
MAIFHFTVALVSRGKGQSAIAKAAYNARDNIRDERTGEMKDYSRKDGLEFSGIFAPKDAPEWTRDRAALWNAVELKEDQSTRPQTAQLARSIDLALTMREITPEGFGAKVREWNDRGEVEKWREAWERTTNRYLERHGHEARIDRRTLEAQGIEREPTKHRGPHVDAMQRKGMETERGNAYRDTVERNGTVGELKSQLQAVERQIDEETRGRWVAGPQRGGMVEHQAWAMEQVRAADERRRQDEDSRKASEKTADAGAAEPEIDLARFRSDPDYRRELMAREKQKMSEERRANREQEPRQRSNERERER